MDPQFWQLFLSAELPPRKARAFLEKLGSFVDPVSALRSWRDLSIDERERINRSDNNRLKKALDQGVHLLPQDQFPDSLAHCPSPPYALFAWGDTTCLEAPKVAVVGTRRATTYGKAATQKFAETLARAGVTVVSGGAMGIDTAAHKGALEGHGATAVVLGNSIDESYPSSNAPLYQQIRENGGCLLSQFPIGKPSLPQNFLLRNQIIAAICDALLVIEAPLRSGSLSTSTAAADMGKPVFVVPGNIVLENYKGSHMLIREGATLVDHPDQVLEAMGWESLAPTSNQQGVIPGLSETQAAILDQLGDLPLNPESIVQTLDLSPSVVLSELTTLELEGLVVKDGSGYARKP